MSAAAAAPAGDDHPLTIHPAQAKGGGSGYDAAKGAPVLADYMDSPGHITPDGERRYNAARAAWQQMIPRAPSQPDAPATRRPPLPALRASNYDRHRMLDVRRRAALLVHGDHMLAKLDHEYGKLNPEFGTLHRPLGTTPATISSIDNSRTRGDINHTQNFTINGPNIPQNLEAARLMADRGHKDVVRNMIGMER